MSKLAVVVIALVPAAFGQAIVEKAVLGSTGAASGAMVGKGVVNVMKGLSGPLEKAGAGAATAPAATPAGGVAGDLYNPSAPSSRATAAALKRRAAMTPAQRLVEAEVAMVGSAAAKAAPTVSIADVPFEQFATIENGLSRADLVAKLGNPAMKMTLPGDGGKELEIYRYRSAGKDAAVIKLLGGLVNSVEILER